MISICTCSRYDCSGRSTVAPLHGGSGAVHSGPERADGHGHFWKHAAHGSQNHSLASPGCSCLALRQGRNPDHQAGLGALFARQHALGPSPRLPLALRPGPRVGGESSLSGAGERGDSLAPPLREAVRRHSVAGGGAERSVLRVPARHRGELRNDLLQRGEEVGVLRLHLVDDQGDRPVHPPNHPAGDEQRCQPAHRRRVPKLRLLRRAAPQGSLHSERRRLLDGLLRHPRHRREGPKRRGALSRREHRGLALVGRS